MRSLQNPGVRAGLASALLFGVGAPLAKLLLGDVSPWLLAGLLYLGSGLGLGIYRVLRRTPGVRLHGADLLRLGGAVVFGGMLGPVLLLVGLSALPASGASLLLNAEGVLTAVLAWVVFREAFDARVGLGMLAIVAGAVVLSIPDGRAELGTIWPTLAVLGACACWALDNNLTRGLALNDATWLAAVKGLVAGPVNLCLALLMGSAVPSAVVTAAALVVGLFAYGISLVLFILALRHVGTARASAYFSVAPFFGATVAIGLGDPVTPQLVAAAGLMALGVWLHLTERHDHPHTHAAEVHDHWHSHDDGHHDHDHDHPEQVSPHGRHRHPHVHPAVTHSHPHFPDVLHRHRH